MPGHLSIAWGITLAILALLEWNSLEREPLREPILSPFIERTISLGRDSRRDGDSNMVIAGEDPATSGSGLSALQTVVDIRFNGPLFLVCFFGPVLLLHAVSMLFCRLWGNSP
jgi:hypothetical protein